MLWKVLGQRYRLITREDRLDAVAKDIVHHFLNRGYQGKAMVVSIDKLTTLRMVEKVRAEWEAEKTTGWKSLRREKLKCDGHRRDATGVGIRLPAASRADGEGGPGGEWNIEHRTPNIEHRSEQKRKMRPTLQWLNPDLPAKAIEGAVEEILNFGFWILDGRGRRKKGPCRRRFSDFTKSDIFTIC